MFGSFAKENGVVPLYNDTDPLKKELGLVLLTSPL